MKFISNRYSLKIPREIFLIYFEKQQKLLIINKSIKILIKLQIKIKILKNKNYIVVTDIPFIGTSKNLKHKKILQGQTYFHIKKMLVNSRRVTYKKLKLIGVGYKVFEINNFNLNYNLLHFKLGYSHNIFFKIPYNLNITTRQSTKLFISSYNSDFVSNISAVIKNYKYPEPYKGKGILYSDETIKLKEGKKI